MIRIRKLFSRHPLGIFKLSLLFPTLERMNEKLLTKIVYANVNFSIENF